MPKFGYDYRIIISDIDIKTKEISNVEINADMGFRIAHNALLHKEQQGILDLDIWGLGEGLRSLLRKRIERGANSLIIKNGELVYNPAEVGKTQSLDNAQRLGISLFLGYRGENLSLVFSGAIQEATPDYDDGGIVMRLHCVSDLSYVKKAIISATTRSRQETIETLFKAAGLKVGNIQIVEQDYLRPKLTLGNPFKILHEMANGVTEEFFSVNGYGYFQVVNSLKHRRIIKVNADDRMLTTPVRTSYELSFKSMMREVIIPGSIISVESLLDPSIDGFYQVFMVNYSGDFINSPWNLDVLAHALPDGII